jgi:hypothetical protein
MIYVACVFSWFSGILINVVTLSVTTAAVDGVCMSFTLWASRTAMKTFAIWYCLSFFSVPMFIFIFCYTRILGVVRRQNQIVHGHHNSAATNTSSVQSQINIIKTMIIVTAFFTISWFQEKQPYCNSCQSSPGFQAWCTTLLLT